LLLIVVVLAGQEAAARAHGPAANTTADIVFVCDGAGNYQIASKMVRGVVEATDAPLKVETFVWSHGYKKIIPDQTDVQHARQQGKLLADAVLAYRQQYPDAKIHILGHSAGSMVVLAATDFLAPETLDHIVLLAPSVSTEYDIRPALRSVRGSVEVHYSSQDWFYLSVCTFVVGCADHCHADASGRVGFRLLVESPQDAALLPHLVQHPWQPSYRQLGNEGGHYGAYQPDYLKAQVLPVLLGNAH
jgi:pimeloyl-ACP methyl ester carboxylesterase